MNFWYMCLYPSEIIKIIFSYIWLPMLNVERNEDGSLPRKLNWWGLFTQFYSKIKQIQSALYEDSVSELVIIDACLTRDEGSQGNWEDHSVENRLPWKSDNKYTWWKLSMFFLFFFPRSQLCFLRWKIWENWSGKLAFIIWKYIYLERKLTKVHENGWEMSEKFLEIFEIQKMSQFVLKSLNLSKVLRYLQINLVYWL